MVRRSSTEKFERIEHIRDRVHAAPGRPARPALAGRHAARRATPTRSTTWPRCLRRRLLDPADTDRRVHRRRRDPDARGDARGARRRASTGVLERDVRQGARGPAERDDAVLPPLALWRGQGYGHFITVNYRESYDLHATSGICSTTSRPRRGLEFVTRKITWHAAAIKLGLAERAAPRAISTRSATGASPGTTCEAMWLMLQQDEPEDYVIATGAAHSVRDCLEIAFDHAGIEIDDTSRWNERCCARQRSTIWSAMPDKAGSCSAGSRTSASRS